MRVGILGNDPKSPAVFTTTTGIPMHFHSGKVETAFFGWRSYFLGEILGIQQGTSVSSVVARTYVACLDRNCF